MKPWDAALVQHYNQTTMTLAIYWRVTRQDGQVYGWVEHDRDRVISDVTYRATAGLQASAAQSTMDVQPGTLDVTAFLEVSSEAELEAGVWDAAQVTIFEARWDMLPTAVDAAQCNILLHGRLGKIDRKTGTFQAQLHGLLEQLDTQIGRVFSAACPWRLGDSRCQVDLEPHTRTGTITALGADAHYSFRDLGQGEADGFFNEGVLTLTSGVNTGVSVDVRQWADQTFTLHRPLARPVAVGDTYSAVRGDDKTWDTCVGVFHNPEKFGGFPFLPGIDQVVSNPLVRPVP